MKKLFQDAWRIFIRKKREHSQLATVKDTNRAHHTNIALAALNAQFDAALNAQQAGRMSEARAAYRSILAQMPDHAPAVHYLGVSHAQSGDLVEAERLIRKSIHMQQAPEYLSNLAMVLGLLSKRDDVVAVYRDLVRLDPGNVLAHHGLGDALTALAQHEDAAQAYQGALAVRPDDADTYFKLGMALAEIKRLTEAVDAYRNALSLRPTYLDAYNNLGNLFKNMRRYADAEEAYRQALVLQPGSAAVHCNLGQLLQESGRHAEAEAAYREAVALQPQFAGAHNNLANLYASAGRRAAAEAAYRHAIFLQPEYADAHNNLGSLLKESGNHAEAEAAYRQALVVNPNHADAWGNLGVLLGDAANVKDAEMALRKALSLKPDSAAIYNSLGNFLCKTKRKKEGEAAFRRALELDADYSDARSNLGALLQDGGKLGDAEALYRKALSISPKFVGAYNNLGHLLTETKRYTEAETVLNQALALQPDFADAYVSIGNLYKDTGRGKAAEASYRRAIALMPNLAGAYSNLGLLLQGADRFAEAEAAYRQALVLDPELDFAQYNFALFCLFHKRFDEGWEKYEWRWKIKYFNSLPRQFPQPQWRGEVLGNEILLVWQEQGVGDIILYAGMIPDLLARGMRLLVECEPRLEPLLARSFPGARVVVRDDPAHPATLAANWQIPLGSLGRWLRMSQKDFSRRGRYLVPDAGRVSMFKERYRTLGRGPVVGISWRSSNDKVGNKKSSSLAEWVPLLSMPGVTFVNLQYGDCEDDLSSLRRGNGINVYHDKTVDALKDIDSFAAQVAAMDLVISTSNSTVHFSGALDVPTWTLLPKAGDGLLWYWFSEDEESLWYPNMRLFRQDSSDDWSGILRQAAEALRGFLTKFH